MRTQGTHNPSSIRHIYVDCRIQQILQPLIRQCHGCFPQTYFLSNVSHACFTEFVPSVSVGHYFEYVRERNGTEALHTEVLRLFRQGFHAVRLMHGAGVRHCDLTFRNMVVRVDVAVPRLVVLDFGGSHSLEVPESQATHRERLGNMGTPDLFAYACAYYMYVYPDATNGDLCDQFRLSHSIRHAEPPPLGSPDDPSLFRSVLEWVLRRSLNRARLPDMDAVEATFRHVTRLW